MTSCGKKEEEQEEKKIDPEVIGTWEYTSEGIDAIYVLEKDGTGSYTITVEDNTIVKEVDFYTEDSKLMINYDKDPDTFELPYRVEGDVLIVTDSLEEELEYYKK